MLSIPRILAAPIFARTFWVSRFLKGTVLTRVLHIGGYNGSSIHRKGEHSMRGRCNLQTAMLALGNLSERVPPAHLLKPSAASKTTSSTACPVTSIGCTRGQSSLRSARASAECTAAHLTLLCTEQDDLLSVAGLHFALQMVLGHGPDGAELRSGGFHQEQTTTTEQKVGRKLA